MLKRANKEDWYGQRQQTSNTAAKLVQQKVANEIARNAERLQVIRKKLIERLEREIDALPDKIGSETSITVNGEKKSKKQTVWSLKALTAAYNDLVEEDFKREKMELERQKAESEEW